MDIWNVKPAANTKDCTQNPSWAGCWTYRIRGSNILKRSHQCIRCPPEPTVVPQYTSKINSLRLLGSMGLRFADKSKIYHPPPCGRIVIQKLAVAQLGNNFPLTFTGPERLLKWWRGPAIGCYQYPISHLISLRALLMWVFFIYVHVSQTVPSRQVYRSNWTHSS